MNWRASALILAAGLLAGCGKPAPPAPAEEKPADPVKVKTVAPTHEYWGEVGDPELGAVDPKSLVVKSLVVTKRADFEKLWKVWWPHGKTPDIDFTTSFATVVVWSPGAQLPGGLASKPPKGTDGVHVTALKVLQDGSARFTMKPHVSDGAGEKEKWVVTKGFYWGISVFPREGVKTVDEKDLPPP